MGTEAGPGFPKCMAWAVLLMGLWFAAPVWAAQIVRVGVYQNSPKVALSAKGEAEGIFVDLLEAIAHKEGWRIEYVQGTWAEGLARLEAGEIDLMPDVAMTVERQSAYAFHSEPVLASWNQVYSRRDSGIRTLLDLQSKRVAVLAGSIQEKSFLEMAAGFSLSVTLVPQPDFDAAFAAVARRDADAVVTNRFFGVRNAGKYGLEDTAIIFSPSNLFFAAPRTGHEALLATIDKHLLTFKKSPDSIYFKSLRRWSLEDTPALTPPWLAPVLSAVVALVAVGLAWVVFLRRQVAAKTVEIRQRSDEILVVNRTLRATGSRRELSAVLEEAIKGALALTGFDGGVLRIRDPKSGVFLAGVRLNMPAGDVEAPIMPEAVVRERRHLLVAADAASLAVQTADSGQPGRVRWHAYFPLLVRDQIIGVLHLISRQTDPASAHVLGLVNELCGPVALAMENARMHEQAQQHAQNLEQRVIERMHEIGELSVFLQAIINHIADPIFYKGADLRFRGCNAAYERTFGVAMADMLGKTVLDLTYLPQADREIYQAEDAQVLASGTTLRREAAIPFADGRLHQTLYSVSGFRGADGQPAGLVGVITDITSMKDTQEALRAAMEAAEAADRLKSAFLATMSHELRTPLNSIIGFTGIVLQELAGPLNAEQSKQLGMVRDSARHLLALINDVLDISKIEAGELPVAHEPFNLAHSLEKVSAIVRPLAEKKGLSLTLQVAPGIGTMVSDVRRVEQVLLNLLGNAIKFSEVGGVTLEALPVDDFCHDGTTQSLPAVRLSVTDTGIGIKPEDMAVLFTPFRQIDSRLSRKHDGTGLGLAICRRLATLMGGTIEARSQWGQGSVFTVTLPLQASADQDKA